MRLNKILLTLLLVLTLSGCKDPKGTIIAPAGYNCETWHKYTKRKCLNNSFLFKNICDRSRQAKFIIDCATAANPMSDEEGEDLVEQCERTSKNLFCEREYFKNQEVNNEE